MSGVDAMAASTTQEDPSNSSGGGGGGLALDRLSPLDQTRLEATLTGLLPRVEPGRLATRATSLLFRINFNFREK